MKNKVMVIVAILATLLLPLASSGKAEMSSSHDGPEREKSARGPVATSDDQQIAAPDLVGLPVVPRALILLTLLVVTGAATTDVVNGEVRRRRMHRLHAAGHVSREIQRVEPRTPVTLMFRRADK